MTRILPAVVLASLTINGVAPPIPDWPHSSHPTRLRWPEYAWIRCATDLYKKLRAQSRFSELDDLKKKTGFDPTRDVTEMLIATNGKDAVTVARGHFSPPIRTPRNQPTRVTR